MIFDRCANKVLKNQFAGKSIFSIMTGPSFSSAMADKLKDRYTFSIKVLPLTFFPPTIWCCLEAISNIPWKIWENPNIIKIVSDGLFDKGYLKPVNPNSPKQIFNSEEIKRLQNIYYIKLNEHYCSVDYFKTETVTWGMTGNHVDEHGIKGRRSIMLAHFRILHYMGFRKIYLCGVDFNMSSIKPYCYDRTKTDNAIHENNILYETLQIRFKALKPIFDEAGLEVYNCNPDSKLSAFPFISFQEALHDNQSMHRN